MYVYALRPMYITLKMNHVCLCRYYLAYTDYPLPLPKLDLLVVPGKAYSMENWGLLTFDSPRCVY